MTVANCFLVTGLIAMPLYSRYWSQLRGLDILQICWAECGFSGHEAAQHCLQPAQVLFVRSLKELLGLAYVLATNMSLNVLLFSRT